MRQPAKRSLSSNNHDLILVIIILLITIIISIESLSLTYEYVIFPHDDLQLKKVTGVHLPALANLPYYVPPPVTDVMSISFGTSGVFQFQFLNFTLNPFLKQILIMIAGTRKASLRCEDELGGFGSLSSCLF